MIRKTHLITAVLLGITAVSFQGCLWYLTHDRQQAIVPGIAIDPTLVVAEQELQEGGWGSVLTIWAIRDQFISPAQAARISELYFSHIDSLKRSFNIWHLTWAVTNMYRLGSDSVKAVLDSAGRDASRRAAHLSRTADRFANGKKLYMGDAHIGGRIYAHRHLIVPGNKKYLQSVGEYRKKEQ